MSMSATSTPGRPAAKNAREASNAGASAAPGRSTTGVDSWEPTSFSVASAAPAKRSATSSPAANRWSSALSIGALSPSRGREAGRDTHLVIAVT
jgi:hypothetical protein